MWSATTASVLTVAMIVMMIARVYGSTMMMTIMAGSGGSARDP